MIETLLAFLVSGALHTAPKKRQVDFSRDRDHSPCAGDASATIHQGDDANRPNRDAPNHEGGTNPDDIHGWLIETTFSVPASLNVGSTFTNILGVSVDQRSQAKGARKRWIDHADLVSDSAKLKSSISTASSLPLRLQITVLTFKASYSSVNSL
jgi:hypothetical protein